MIDLDRLLPALNQLGLTAWARQLPTQLDRVQRARSHGDQGRWRAAISATPVPPVMAVALDRDAVTAHSEADAAQRAAIATGLRALNPWRKGPYDLHGVYVDSEWRSNWKWRRALAHMSPLMGRAVLDIGSGNGYYLWRMVGAGARLALGVDPTRLYLAQFELVRRLLGGDWPLHVLPLGIEDLPTTGCAVDTVFSMGVLYHRRSPLDHLIDLRNLLRAGGELVLETLVIDGGRGQVLVPAHRYAKMGNVWFIPSLLELENWLRRVGFRQVRAVDVTPTTVQEQRATEWMRFESLADYLDPTDQTHTIEGHPAPIRAMLLAEAP